MCEQETKLIRDKAKEIGDEYRILYPGKMNGSNEYGIIWDEATKTKVVKVIRKCNRIIS